MSAVFMDTRKSHAFLPPEKESNTLRDTEKKKGQGLFNGDRRQNNDEARLRSVARCLYVVILVRKAHFCIMNEAGGSGISTTWFI